jgi:hypothetical protein
MSISFRSTLLLFTSSTLLLNVSYVSAIDKGEGRRITLAGGYSVKLIETSKKPIAEDKLKPSSGKTVPRSKRTPTTRQNRTSPQNKTAPQTSRDIKQEPKRSPQVGGTNSSGLAVKGKGTKGDVRKGRNKTTSKVESSKRATTNSSRANKRQQRAKGNASTKKATQANNSKGIAGNKSTTTGSTKRTSKRKIIGVHSYPRQVRTKAGTLVIHDKYQEIEEILRVDRERGYISYTNNSAVYQRFTLEGLKKIEQEYGKRVANMARQANKRNGNRLLDAGFALEADLVRFGVAPEKARKAANEYIKDPSKGSDKDARTKAVVNGLGLPKELIGLNFNDKELTKLASEFAILGGEDPNQQISPEFFNDWAKVRNRGKVERKKFIKKWVSDGRLQNENRFKTRDNKVKDKDRGKITTPGRGKGKGGKRVNKVKDKDRGKITTSGRIKDKAGKRVIKKKEKDLGKNTTPNESTPTGSGFGPGGPGPGSGGGKPEVGPRNPNGVPGPGGGGPGGGSTPTGSASSPDGPGSGSGTRGSDRPSNAGRIGYTEISNVQSHSDGSYSYQGQRFDEYGEPMGSSISVTCSAGTCTDTYSNGQTSEPYEDDRGTAPQEGPDFEDDDTTGKTMEPGSGPDRNDSVVKAGEVDKQQTKNDQLTNPGNPGGVLTGNGKKTVVLDPHEDRINSNPDLAGSKGGQPSSNSVSPQGQRINIKPELATDPKNSGSGSGKPTGTRYKKDPKGKKKSIRSSKERAQKRSQQRHRTPSSQH